MSNDWQATIQQAYRSFLAAKQIKPRQGQMHMVADLAKSFYAIQEDAEGLRTSSANNLADHLIVIEAGTGTGKTLAYLLATLPLAKLKDKNLVISTATIALQEQLLNKDLPDLAKHTDLDFTYALAKGRGRYLCTLQLVKALEEGTAANTDATSTFGLFEQEVLAQQPLTASKALEELAEAYTSGKWNGDKDQLEKHPPNEVWARLTTDNQRCKRNNCPHFANACPFYAARRELEDADLIVANHDLVLADLALGGGKILPEPKNTYYVFDEAHHLAGKALNHFSANFRFNSSLKWLNLLKKNLPELIKTFPLASFSNKVNELDAPLTQLSEDLGQAYETFSQLLANQQQYVFGLKETQPALSSLVANLATNFNQLTTNLSWLTKQLSEAQDPEKNPGLNSDEAEKWQPSLALLNQRAQGAADLWALFNQANSPAKTTPLARWINQLSFNQGDEELEVNASPVSAAEALTNQLWISCYGAALTSATLTALGKFNRLHLATGLAANTPSRIYPSPFNYPELGVIEVPKQACDPRNGEVHTKAIVEYLTKELDLEKLAGLVLFTSRRQMKEVYELLPQSLTKFTYTQDELPKTLLLEKHKKRVDNQQPSLLFGLASLAEGIDLPGKYLTHLIITRLPFASPDDPIEVTLAQWLEEQGRKPFFEISVPDASIRLIQACGRLIRTETDTGKITILDQRLIKQRYGQDLLNSLPPFRREFA